jgi:nodulation protein E
MDRFAQFSVIAAREAVEQAPASSGTTIARTRRHDHRLLHRGTHRRRSGYWNLFHLNKNRVHPLTIPLGMANSGASQISMEFGVHGPTFTFSTACSSSAHALGHAFWMVRSGAAPWRLPAAPMRPIYYGNMKAWEAMRVVSQDTCRPFSIDRGGMILGEGAAMLVLEPLEAALARGARGPSPKLSASACLPTPVTSPSRSPRALPAPFAAP